MAVSVRMNALLEKELEQAAQRKGITKSQFIIDAVESALGRKTPTTCCWPSRRKTAAIVYKRVSGHMAKLHRHTQPQAHPGRCLSNSEKSCKHNTKPHKAIGRHTKPPNAGASNGCLQTKVWMHEGCFG